MKKEQIEYALEHNQESWDHYGLPVVTFDDEPGEYAIAENLEEAEEAAKKYIKETVWAFNPSFLRYWTGQDEELIRSIQEQQHEDCNDLFLKLIGDKFDDFAEDALLGDGIGHFLDSYSGNEEESEDSDHIIFRIN